MSLLFLAACWTGDYTSGASEVITVRKGSFHEGALPEDGSATSPTVLYAASVGYVITQGQANIDYSGLTTKDAYSVAVAFPDVGTGYWVVPVKGPDVTQDNNLLFGLTVDFSEAAPYGLTSISFTAIDGSGHPGPRYDATLCVLPDFADGNFAACAPEVPPQDTVLSLSWDTNVDLDLIVVTPAGKVVTPDSPSTALDEDDEGPIGVLSRDSNGGCDIDGIRLESLVFEEEPPSGDYEVYASLFSPCGEPAVNYGLTLHEAVADGKDAWSIQSTDLASGALLASAADGGATLGTFVATVSLP